jgi:hypothetical protein
VRFRAPLHSELLFASFASCESEQLILGFPVIEWDSDDENGTGPVMIQGDEALCREIARSSLLQSP